MDGEQHREGVPLVGSTAVDEDLYGGAQAFQRGYDVSIGVSEDPEQMQDEMEAALAR
jgi:hypothetical protein